MHTQQQKKTLCMLEIHFRREQHFFGVTRMPHLHIAPSYYVHEHQDLKQVLRKQHWASFINH